jgi:hypothetical protein
MIIQLLLIISMKCTFEYTDIKEIRLCQDKVQKALIIAITEIKQKCKEK